MSQTIKIYPTNWLMAAGIVGFEKIFGGKNSNNKFYELKDNYLEILKPDEFKENFFNLYFQKADELKVPLRIFYNNSRVSNNRFKTNNQIDYQKTTYYFFNVDKDNNLLCSFCDEREAIIREGNLVCLDEVHFTPLASSPTNLKNLYWEGKQSNFLCLYCELIIYCAAFGFTNSGNKYIFVYAPTTLEELVNINNVWSAYLNKSFKESLIEILKRIEKYRAKWTIQNISFIELSQISGTTTFNIYNFNIPPEVATAIRKMIQSYPNELKDIYDTFLDYIYSRKPLYELVSTVLYGYINKEKLKRISDRELGNSTTGRLILSGKKLKNPKELLFFLKFQKEVESYGQ
ncbi:MAG: type I-B CRISPR-associated protein Cas8b1/Cst1 [Aquificaceae bacterium]